MVKKEKTARQFRAPVVEKNAVVLKFGMARSPTVLTLGGPGGQYVELKKMSPWLCEIVSGKTYSSSPLHRSKLIEKFKDSLSEGPDKKPVAGDKMALLATPAPAAVAHAKTKVEFEKVVWLPGKFDSDEPRSWKIWHKAGSDCPWVHIDHLADAVVHMNSEVVAHGVREAEDTQEPNQKPAVSWDRRDLCWSVRVKGEISGMLHRTSFYVPRKSATTGEYLCSEEFQAQKNAQEMMAQEWAKEHRQQ